MNKIIPLLLATGLVANAIAQKIPNRPDGPPPPPNQRWERKGKMHDLPLKELNLTDAQKESFRKQREDFKQRMDALKKQDDLSVKEWKSRMETLRKEQRTAMQNILTPEQKDQMKKMREDHQDRQIQHMKEQLGLTDDQTAQIKKQRAATEKQLQTIRENNSLSANEKKEAIKKLLNEQKQSFDALLTPEQKNKKEGNASARRTKGSATS